MAITGNKGEWSEIYTLFRLLGEGKVHAGDANLNKLKLYYPIIDIIREESKRYDYKPNQKRNVVIISEDGKECIRIPMSQFLTESKALLDAISKGGNRAFEVPNTEQFMKKIGCTKLKAPSKSKADIQIVIHDLRTSTTPLLGFSIKSQLGSPSTLLNPGKTTNITYCVNGGITDKEINAINSIGSHLDRMRALQKYSITPSAIENDTFYNNLLFLDAYMPQFISDCLLKYNLSGHSVLPVKEVVSSISGANPFGFKGKSVNSFYEHKMKVLLIAIALGMTPAKEWTGRYDANGGYLVVKTDGEIVCYHFYNINDVEDYLYNNTRFECASRGRYDFGYLFRGNDGKVYIKLNLQIRFSK